MTLKIRRKKLAHGYETCQFDIHQNGRRKFEGTGIRFKSNPTTPIEKQHKKDMLKIIEHLAKQRELELLRQEKGLDSDFDPNANFIAYVDDFIEHHAIKEIKKFHAMRKKFVAFVGKEYLACYEINEHFLKRFVVYLESKLNGESPSNYFSKLKQVITSAVSDGILRFNPTERIRVKKTEYLLKDVLSIEEIRLLKGIEIRNLEVRNAFIFCTLTGLRFCDIKKLTWGEIHRDKISIVQQKTKVPLTIPLSEDMKMLLPKRRESNMIVFNLPSHTACQKWVKKLVRVAGIEKNISWHSGRHTFGTNLIKYDGNIAVASKLLGHTSIVNTQRYVKVNDEMKKSAISKLPSL